MEGQRAQAQAQEQINEATMDTLGDTKVEASTVIRSMKIGAT
jgi:hypothetical protein